MSQFNVSTRSPRSASDRFNRTITNKKLPSRTIRTTVGPNTTIANLRQSDKRAIEPEPDGIGELTAAKLTSYHIRLYALAVVGTP